MRVDSFRDIAAGMAKDAALGRFIGVGIVEQRGHGMPAVVCRMAVGTNAMHDRPPEEAVAAVGVRTARLIGYKTITGAFHPCLNERQDSVMYRNDADAGSGFAVRDADISLAQVYI